MNLSSWLYICIKKFTKVPKNDWIYLCVSYEEYILPTILKNGPSLTLKSLWSLFEECTCKPLCKCLFTLFNYRVLLLSEQLQFILLLHHLENQGCMDNFLMLHLIIIELDEQRFWQSMSFTKLNWFHLLHPYFHKRQSTRIIFWNVARFRNQIAIFEGWRQTHEGDVYLIEQD